MKILKVGVSHHDCWGSFSTHDYPDVSMTEMGAVKIVREDRAGALVDSFFRITAATPERLREYLTYLKTIPSIKELKIYGMVGTAAYAFIRFLSRTSSYGTVLKAGAMPIGPIVQEHELEIHTVVTEDPKRIVRLLNALEQIGEVQVFKISEFREEPLAAGLTAKQQQALLTALNAGYYSWPRNITLDEISQKQGMKRRTFQEHLRLAETKIIPAAIEKLLKERKF